MIKAISTVLPLVTRLETYGGDAPPRFALLFALLSASIRFADRVPARHRGKPFTTADTRYDHVTVAGHDADTAEARTDTTR